MRGLTETGTGTNPNSTRPALRSSGSRAHVSTTAPSPASVIRRIERGWLALTPFGVMGVLRRVGSKASPTSASTGGNSSLRSVRWTEDSASPPKGIRLPLSVRSAVVA